MTLGSRIREQNTRAKAPVLGQHQVHRWRYTYTPVAPDVTDTVATRGHKPGSITRAIVLRGKGKGTVPPSPNTVRQGEAIKNLVASQPNYFKPSPTQDHLLHLIQINAFRGFFDNKIALLASTNYLTKSDLGEMHVVAPEQVFPGRAAIKAVSNALPESLRPTQLQTTIIHATCIDLIPFPAIRDNLIKNEGRFSWPELIEEFVGHLVSPSCFVCPFVSRKARIPYQELLSYDDTDDFTANRSGVILWGPAHCAENWEFTPSFLRKWGWVLEGCQGIIELTNWWRRSREEEPLRML